MILEFLPRQLIAEKIKSASDKIQLVLNSEMGYPLQDLALSIHFG
jgi:hypothetical protein